MEKNRSTIFKIVGSVLVLGVAGAVLFGLTGVVKDPAVDTANKVESAMAQQQPPKSEPAAIATQEQPKPEEQKPLVATPIDGGSKDEVVATKDDSDPFPQFDDEPTGS